jgi:carboxymethylenebutenolidase
MADQKHEITRVEVASANKKGALHLYEVKADKPDAPGLVVVQEWWGVNDQIKNRAAWFASHGFHAVVPDLYRGKVATDHEEAGHLMNDLDWPGAVADIAAAAEYLKTHGAKKVGVVGYCMGGALSFASGVHVPALSAAAPFYGIPQKQLADVSKIKIPVQAHFGKLDSMKGFSDPEAAAAVERDLKAAGVPHEVCHYENAGHAFTRETTPETFRKEAFELSHKRVLEFFNKYLQ